MVVPEGPRGDFFSRALRLLLRLIIRLPKNRVKPPMVWLKLSVTLGRQEDIVGVGLSLAGIIVVRRGLGVMSPVGGFDGVVIGRVMAGSGRGVQVEVGTLVIAWLGRLGVRETPGVGVLGPGLVSILKDITTPPRSIPRKVVLIPLICFRVTPNKGCESTFICVMALLKKTRSFRRSTRVWAFKGLKIVTIRVYSRGKLVRVVLFRLLRVGGRVVPPVSDIGVGIGVVGGAGLGGGDTGGGDTGGRALPAAVGVVGVVGTAIRGSGVG